MLTHTSPPAGAKPTPLQLNRERKGSESSSISSLQVPRTPRFAEATAVHSPIDGKGRSPFDDPPEPSMSAAAPAAKPSDIGFGYISDNTATRHVEIQVGPASPGLKSAMKVPGTPGRALNPLSPTFREEQVLEKQEEITEKQQEKDLVR